MDIPGPNITPADTNGRPSVMTVCLIIITVCVVGTALAALRSVITPVLIGLFLFFLVNPLVAFFEERKVPSWMTYMIIGLWAVVAVYAIGWFIQNQAEAFKLLLPKYKFQFEATLDSYAQLVGLADIHGHFNSSLYSLKDLIPISPEELFGHVFGMTVEALESAALAIFYLLFMLIEARRWAMRTWNNLENDSAAKVLSAVEKMKVDIWSYLMVKTAVSAGLGLTVAMVCFLFGLDFWLLWGFLMFLANYVTYLGSILALAPPILLAFVQFSNPAVAGGLAAVLVAVRFVWIDYVEIRYSGMHINVSPLLLLFSLALLGWMWGMVGLLLAVPLVTSLRIALDSNPETTYLARLMSDGEAELNSAEAQGI